EAFYTSDKEISIIIQWDDSRYGDSSVDNVNQLEMIGRSLHFNIRKYLGFECVIGISQILKGREFISELSGQAEKALRWSREHKDHHVFYFGDFKWNPLSGEDPSDEEMAAQNNLIVERSTEYIHQNYAQKGLTLNEIAQRNHVSPNYLSYLFKKNT